MEDISPLMVRLFRRKRNLDYYISKDKQPEMLYNDSLKLYNEIIKDLSNHGFNVEEYFEKPEGQVEYITYCNYMEQHERNEEQCDKCSNFIATADPTDVYELNYTCTIHGENQYNQTNCLDFNDCGFGFNERLLNFCLSKCPTCSNCTVVEEDKSTCTLNKNRISPDCDSFNQKV